MTPEDRDAAFRALAADLDGRDLATYARFELDPQIPVLGGGPPDARVCFFGRDPGTDEIRHRRPFIGAGGQKIRRVLHEVVHGTPMPDFEASVAIGEVAFWANTVPYKPLGNKAWSMAVRRAFQPMVADLLVHDWRGEHVLCLGQNAFSWFGLGLDRDGRRALQDRWRAEPRFEGTTRVCLTAPDGASRTLIVHPLPHPSPLNATWAPRFAELLEHHLRLAGF